MKNKGYTLIELLGVLIILASILTIVFPSLINFIKSSNEKKDNITRDLVYNATEMFIEDNSDKYYSNYGSKYCISIDTLIQNNYLKGDLKYQGEVLDNTKSVQVTYTDKFNYEITDIDDCTVCKLVNDVDGNNSISIGDKYQCKVKDNMEEDFEEGYYFYVLSQDNNDTTNLIMDRNVCEDGTMATTSNTCAVPWYENTSDNRYGPITAMTYLYNATKNWINIPPMNYKYHDYKWQKSLGIEMVGGYDSFISLNGEASINGTKFTGDKLLRARMPIYAQSEAGVEYGELSSLNENNEYLYENMNESGIENIYGYWTLSASSDNIGDAWRVFDNSVIGEAANYPDDCGVRPVISVSNSLILN